MSLASVAATPLNCEVRPLEVGAYHPVEALLRHLVERQEFTVTCIDEDAVQMTELPLDRGEHRVEVREIADIRANGKTSGAKRLLSRLQRLLIQAADGNARALSVEFLRCGQPDSAVAAGDKNILARQPAHCRHSFRLTTSRSAWIIKETVRSQKFKFFFEN